MYDVIIQRMITSCVLFTTVTLREKVVSLLSNHVWIDNFGDIKFYGNIEQERTLNIGEMRSLIG